MSNWHLTVNYFETTSPWLNLVWGVVYYHYVLVIFLGNLSSLKTFYYLRTTRIISIWKELCTNFYKVYHNYNSELQRVLHHHIFVLYKHTVLCKHPNNSEIIQDVYPTLLDSRTKRKKKSPRPKSSRLKEEDIWLSQRPNIDTSSY